MDYKNIVTFIINNNQYYLHYDIVKDLPIFEELKKSDKIETIEYLGEINDNEIQTVFNVMYDRNINYTKIQIDGIIRVNNFMMFLTIDKQIIDNFMWKLFTNFTYSDVTEYGIETNQSKSFFATFPFYTKYISQDTGKYLINLKNDSLKPMIVNIFMDKFANYMSKNIYVSYKNYGFNLLYPYAFLFDIKQRVQKQTAIFENKKLVCINVNNKKVPFVNLEQEEITYFGETYTQYDIYDTVFNHIKQVLLGQVEL